MFKATVGWVVGELGAAPSSVPLTPTGAVRWCFVMLIGDGESQGGEKEAYQPLAD